MRNIDTNKVRQKMSWFGSPEIAASSGLYYGDQSITRGPIHIKRWEKYMERGFILGCPGSGKTKAAQFEMLNVLAHTNDCVIVIDPEFEYGHMAKEIDGEIFDISPQSDVCINPFDFVCSDKHVDFYRDFEMNDKVLLFEALMSLVLCSHYRSHGTYGSITRSCVKQVYQAFWNSKNEQAGGFDRSKLPTLKEFYDAILLFSTSEDLSNAERGAAKDLALALEIFISESVAFFDKPTNINPNSRFTVLQLGNLGTPYKPLGMVIALDYAWHLAKKNRENGVNTWIYIDEFYPLLKNKECIDYFNYFWNSARKEGIIPTATTMCVNELLENDILRSKLANAGFVMLLRQTPYDRKQLADFLAFDERLLVDALWGNGILLCNNKPAPIPFANIHPPHVCNFE